MENKNPTIQTEETTPPPLASSSNANNAAPQANPGSVNAAETKTVKVEEFTYQPKAKINMKSISKVFALIIPFLIIVIPLAYLAMRYFPFKKAEPGRKGEIIWWSLGGNEALLEKMINEYTQKNPNVKITLQVQSETDYGERLINSLKDGSGPDVFTIHNSWVPMIMQYLDFVPASMYSESDYVRDFYPVVAKDFRTSGGIVAIPYEYDAITLYVNDDIFARSAKVYPKTV